MSGLVGPVGFRVRPSVIEVGISSPFSRLNGYLKEWLSSR